MQGGLEPALPASVKRGPRSARSELDPAGDDVAEHDPIADERIERIAERRGAVLLEEKVSDPGEAIAAGQRCQQPPGIALRHRHEQQHQHAATADEMQASTGAVAVFAQVERVKLTEALELPRHESSCEFQG